MADIITDFISQLDGKWLGYKYVIASPEISRIGISIPAIGISEIQFPSVLAELKEIPSLSTEPSYIPSRYNFGELVLRAPVSRNAVLFSIMERQREALRGQGAFSSFDLVIAELDFDGLSQAVPIAIWFAIGCHAISFTTATANNNSSSNMPLDELRLKVTDFYRPTI